MLKDNGKAFFIALIAALLGNMAVMIGYYYMRKNGIAFASLDVARYTTIAIVFTGVLTGVICYAVQKKKKSDKVFEAVTLCTIISLVASFIGSVTGAVISANLFGRIN